MSGEKSLMVFRVKSLPEGRVDYFAARINNNEQKNCYEGALHQNWFAGKNMKLVYEYYERQVFFDSNTKCFYDVNDVDGKISIVEISPSNKDYNKYVGIKRG